MKKIALTQRLISNKDYPETRDALDIRWAKLLERAGLLPIVIPTCYNAETFFSELDPDGLILTGGNDLAEFSEDPDSLLRDAHEKILLELCIQKNIPVFGICRGMQLMTQHFKGQLTKVTSHVGKHPLTIQNRSRFPNFNPSNEVNSYHNYGVKTVPSDFIALNSAPDGTTEAMEHKTLSLYAQMWHPERNEPFSENDITFLRSFFNA